MELHRRHLLLWRATACLATVTHLFPAPPELSVWLVLLCGSKCSRRQGYAFWGSSLTSLPKQKSDVIIYAGDSRLAETPLHTHNSLLSPTKVLGLQAEIKILGSRALELTPSYWRRACGGRHSCARTPSPVWRLVSSTCSAILCDNECQGEKWNCWHGTRPLLRETQQLLSLWNALAIWRWNPFGEKQYDRCIAYCDSLSTAGPRIFNPGWQSSDSSRPCSPGPPVLGIIGQMFAFPKQEVWETD